MGHDKVGLPKPLSFLRVSGLETVDVRRFSVCWWMSWGKNSSTAEGLSFPLVLALAGDPKGSYSLEAVWTIQPIA